MKLCNAYNAIKYARDFEKGDTIMKNYGDPQSQMCHIGGFLSEIYDNVRLVNLTIGKPKPGNLGQIHDKVMKKLECMAYAQRHDTCIGGYPISFCCETATLCKMYTTEQLQAAGIVSALSTSGDPVTSGRLTSSEFEESDITNTEGPQEVAEESMDTEMARRTHGTLMITSDREKVRLEALIKEQEHAVNQVLRQVQQRHLEEVRLIANAAQCREGGQSSNKCCSASREEDIKRSCEESLEYGATPQERGRSLHHKSKSDLRYLALPGKRRPGSWSFTQCTLHSHSRHHSHSKHRSHSRHHSYSRSSMPNQSRHRDSTPHSSRKRPVAKTPKPTEPTLTQSPTQKTPKLKSIILQRITVTPHTSALIRTPRNSFGTSWEIWMESL